MNPRALAFAAALSAFAVAPATASAQRNRGGAQAGQQNLLELGRQQYDDLRYEEALQTLSAAIIRRGNTPQTEIQIYELLALSYQSLNRNDEAEGAYRLVLVRDPNHQLSSDIAPRIIEFFNGVKQRWEAEGRPGIAQQGSMSATQGAGQAAPVAIEHRSPAQQQRNHAVPLTARLDDPGHRVARLVLAFRSGSRGLFRRLDATQNEQGDYVATVPAEAVRPPLVEYYFEAVDSNGVPVQARGDAFAPLRVAVPEPGGIPTWAWIGGGVLVAGAAAAIVVGVIVAGQAQPAHLTIDVRGN
jgi:hypothetical protein